MSTVHIVAQHFEPSSGWYRQSLLIRDRGTLPVGIVFEYGDETPNGIVWNDRETIELALDYRGPTDEAWALNEYEAFDGPLNDSYEVRASAGTDGFVIKIGPTWHRFAVTR